ncbi:protein GRIM REAPER [Heracleum sosnowskyi]|uniref:Protein GRIM REAPER n=1 Tax=Heracleum sosnowskyi TaxID=360622 RepID=A0AAD8IZR1_9APIA|nr:protein GRIM REAPER [Heracleum sosnowskyi]
MATTSLLKLATILSLFTILFITSSSQHSLNDEDGEEIEYVVDTPFANTRLRSRFLADKSVIKKGTTCSQSNKDVCNGISANNGTSLLFCCKTHCRNVLGDKNNCGECGHKCALGQRCCGAICTDVIDNDTNCGKCNKRCLPGVKCEKRICGYA